MAPSLLARTHHSLFLLFRYAVAVESKNSKQVDSDRRAEIAPDYSEIMRDRQRQLESGKSGLSTRG